MFGTILMQRVVSAALCAATPVGLPGCTALQTPETNRTRPAQTQAPERTQPDGITFGTHTRRGFVNDNVYHSHGGWSNETTLMGTPDSPHDFKHIMDHAIEDGKIQPLIIVLPTYNNTSESDSGNYSLALRLTDNFHNELVNDLIPAWTRNTAPGRRALPRLTLPPPGTTEGSVDFPWVL